MENIDPIYEIKTRAIDPWERLNLALTEQRALEASKSDEAREAGRLAAAIRGLAEDFGLDARDLAKSSADWTFLSAVADASKVRLLTSAARRTTLEASAHFEAGDNAHYRFINNRIMIVHPTAGNVEFLAAAAGTILLLISRLGLAIDWTPKILEGPAEFRPMVQLDAGPDPNRVLEMLQVRFYKRNADGELATFQPGDWQLDLTTAGIVSADVSDERRKD
ncbi:MAG: hypothetical protein KA831_05850 [Pyrinomonadaceae bacterium]|nr:hypothetical protein [Pyrinomonadaceae bacterium]